MMIRKPTAFVLMFAISLAISVVDLVADDQTAQVGPRALSKAFRNAARKATPSVVTIFSYGQKIDPETLKDDPDPERTARNKLTGLGSGVIVGAEGTVLTNNHVITGAKRVKVQLHDESEFEATEVLSDSASDIAVLKISPDVAIQAAEVGDSNALEIGDWVLSIGSPFKLEATVSAGIISAKNRQLPRVPRSRLLQTDAAINPGNSGGPLIDLDGKVIGISTAIATRNGGYQGVGFAVPINQASWVAEQLLTHGEVKRSAIGVTMAELNPTIAKKVQLKPWLGVLAYQIIEGSVAEKAGLKPMDVIVEFAGQKVRDPGMLRAQIEQKPIGSTQSIKVNRNGEELMFDIMLAPVDNPVAESESKPESESTEESVE